MQSGQTVCKWDTNDDSCTLRPPPNDPQFIIYVALLTAILSLPIILIVQFVLTTYASNYPGDRGYEKDIEKENADQKVAEFEASKELLRPGGLSNFGEILKNGVLRGSFSKQVSTAEVAKMAYTGKQAMCPDCCRIMM